MTSTPIYRARTVADLLNAVPTLFGFVPHNSFIGICLEGERRRFGFRLRIDLPPHTEMEHVARLVANHLDRGDGESVILMAVGDCTSTTRAMVEAVGRALSTKQVELAFWADEQTWWSKDNATGAAWYPDQFHESIVKAISNGQVIHENRASVENEFHAGDNAIEIDVLEEAERRFELERARSGAVDVSVGVAEVRQAMGALSTGVALEVDALCRVSIWLRNLLVRDHFWFSIDQQNARSSLAQWTYIANRVSGAWRAAPLALASFCAWQSGDGVRALIAAESALSADSGYPLAALMMKVVEEGLPPSSWTRMTSSLHVGA